MYGFCCLGRLLKVATFRLCQDASLFHLVLVGTGDAEGEEGYHKPAFLLRGPFPIKHIYYDFQIIVLGPSSSCFLLWITPLIFPSARKYSNIYSSICIYICVCMFIHKSHIHIYYIILKSFLRSVAVTSISCNCFCYPAIDYMSACVSGCPPRGRECGGLASVRARRKSRATF